jgi:histidinol-phosphate aminotransferase
MASNLNRRELIKKGAIFAGVLPFASSFLNEIAAKPANLSYHSSMDTNDSFVTDADIARDAPPELKARLFANENPFGPSPKAKQAIEEAMATSYQYPFVYTKELTQKIATFEGLNENQIMLGSGSSPLLMAAAILFSKGGGNIVTGDPTYEDLPKKTQAFNEQWIKVPLTPDYKLDLDAMEKSINANTGLVYICNPNNPTATVVDTEKLKSFCERVSQKVTVFIDEAYIDYLPDPQGTTLMSCVKKGQNIIVARTFSKLYGFAGLRVGYIAAQPDMIKKLSNYTEGAMSISATSVKAALAAYQDKEFLGSALTKTIASKNYLYEVLKKEGYEYIPSSANFVMFPVKMEAEKFVAEMMKRGVGVRPWKFNNKQWCRVSIGRMDEMEAFATAFKEIS